VALGRSREEAEREMLYASILALHRDVREILSLMQEQRGYAREAGSLDGLREVYPDDDARTPSSLSLEHMERTAIREALNRSGGNRRRAADSLGISERTLYRKIKEYGLA
jgi:transcriptional regulator with PAS, ATPase and Fis domain